MEGDDVITIYNDRGEVLGEEIPLEALNPYKNQAILEILQSIRRTAFVDISELENALRTGEVGGTMNVGCECQIPGREMDLPLLDRINDIADRVRDLLRISPGDDTRVEVLDSLMVIQIPSRSFLIATDSSQVYLKPATALSRAIAEIFGLGPFDGIEMVKAAVLGRYPQTTAPNGALSALLSFPTQVEGGGNAYRGIMVNHIVALVNRRTFDAAALASVLEHAAAFESGAAMGPYRRYHLFGLAYQGLNADNMVWELLRDHGKGGRITDIIDGVIDRALRDRVIEVEREMPSGFRLYRTRDAARWNAYAAAGLMAAAIHNAGVMRSGQGVPSAMLFYNDLLVTQTGLPGVDLGRALGTSTLYEYLTHNTYGGGEPGTFSAEHPATRGSKGFVIPCAAAAMCLDAGTMMYPPEMTSGKIFKIRKILPEFRDPVKRIADAAVAFEEV
ncbi:MAG TPA: methyl-coenzyme M reductase subunit beta [Candidatus Syntrophoarchaeum butanivorans]|uniref:coenzyme-B sulfoethylthiotransferase n=1 Tax=Candidatus Syntropharchaeum butanivorans TaxID=1839936 RepID=A0A1F2P4W9_9EURY|nr:MAG: methyl coenzyme M reductase beta subunit [Candidatus Syntrophoarchaeum butanivorans]HEC56767.1 methyl-coenzyme M reductase subunit beta [Candidatus Syntrophoarchaeum butanivorans]